MPFLVPSVMVYHWVLSARNRLPGYPKTGNAVTPSSPSQQDHPNIGEHEKRTIETTKLFTFHHVSSNNHQGILQSANLRYPANKNGWVSAVLWRKIQLQLLYRYGKLPTSPDFQIPNETNWVSRLRDIQPEGLSRQTVPCTVRLCKILVYSWLTEIWGTPAPNISSPQKLRDVLALLIFQGPTSGPSEVTTTRLSWADESPVEYFAGAVPAKSVYIYIIWHIMNIYI